MYQNNEQMTEYLNKRNKRAREQTQRLNTQYQQSLQNDFLEGLNNAFSGMNDDLAKRKAENEKKSLLNGAEFSTAFNNAMKDKGYL